MKQKMGTLSSWTTAKNLLKSISPCDIVEFNRNTYSHYGFYIGNGICIHVQAPNGNYLGSSSRSSASSSRRSSKCGWKVAERLIKIAAGDFVRVNNAEFIAFQLGVSLRPENEAKRLAIRDLPLDGNGDVILGRSINVTYFLVSSNNCEGWCTYWKYNHDSGFSIQATNGVVHSTVGTVERVSESVLCSVESILSDDDAPIYKKATAAAVLAPYAIVNYSAKGVKHITDFAVGGIMRLFSD